MTTPYHALWKVTCAPISGERGMNGKCGEGLLVDIGAEVRSGLLVPIPQSEVSMSGLHPF